jgi:hypothetical protein
MTHLRVGDRVRHIDVARPDWSEYGPAMPRTPKRRLYGRVVAVHALRFTRPDAKRATVSYQVRVKRDGVKTIDTWAEVAWERVVGCPA